MARTIAALAALAGLAYADSLKDIDHVILFMQGTSHLWHEAR